MFLKELALRPLPVEPELLYEFLHADRFAHRAVQVQEPFVPLLLSALQNKLAANLTTAEVKTLSFAVGSGLLVKLALPTSLGLNDLVKESFARKIISSMFNTVRDPQQGVGAPLR